MAITKSDCISILSNVKTEEATKIIHELIPLKQPTLNIIKQINDIKPFDCRLFYEKIRKSYNQHKSKLYKNILDTELDSKDVLCCLASLNLQVLLFSKNVENTQLFLRQVRFNEIQKVLYNYSVNGDIIPCQRLLEYFRADIKVLEALSNTSQSTRTHENVLSV